MQVGSLVSSSLVLALGLSLTSEVLALVGLPPEFEVVTDELADAGTPGEAPEAPVIESVTVIRGKGPRRETCSTGSSSSIDGIGAFLVALTIDTTSEPLGYRFAVQGGTAPNGLDLPSYPIAPQANGRVDLNFGDPKETREKPIDVTLSVTAVSRVGQESEPTELVIEHDGSVDRSDEPQCDEGCSLGHARTPSNGIAALAGLTLALGFARRQSRRYGVARPC